MIVYSPSPEYPADCCSEVEIPPIGAAGMNGKVNRAEAHQSEGGLISLYHFTLEWLRRNSALIPRSLLRGASSNGNYFSDIQSKIVNQFRWEHYRFVKMVLAH